MDIPKVVNGRGMTQSHSQADPPLWTCSNYRRTPESLTISTILPILIITSPAPKVSVKPKMGCRGINQS